MTTSRTYLFAQLWNDYPPQFSIARFGSLNDGVLGMQLDRVAASWIRTNLTDPKEFDIGAWACDQPDADPEFLTLFDREQQAHLGIKYMVHALIQKRTPGHPRSVLIHAEPTLDRAWQIGETLEENVQCGYPFQVLLLEQRTLPAKRWLWLDRELAEWDKHHALEDQHQLAKGGSCPQRMLHSEAVKLGALLPLVATGIARGLDGAPAPTVTASAGGEAVAPRLFVRQKGGWDIRYEGEQVSLAHHKGLIYIQRLLERPGERIHVWTLENDEPLPESLRAPGQEVIDSEGREAVRQELGRLAAIAVEHEGAGRNAAAAATQDELERVGRALKVSTTPSGRSRSVPGDVHKCRGRVGKAIVASMRVLDQCAPTLGAHLKATIQGAQGFEPSYQPSPPITWATS